MKNRSAGTSFINWANGNTTNSLRPFDHTVGGYIRAVRFLRNRNRKLFVDTSKTLEDMKELIEKANDKFMRSRKTHKIFQRKKKEKKLSTRRKIMGISWKRKIIIEKS